MNETATRKPAGLVWGHGPRKLEGKVDERFQSGQSVEEWAVLIG